MHDAAIFFGAIALAVVCAVWAIGPQSIGYTRGNRKAPPEVEQGSKK